MTKTIDTLITDMQAVLEGAGGWDEAVNDSFGKAMMNLMDARLNTPRPTGGKGTLRMSNIGQPCGRKLWYNVNGEAGEPLPASARMKFLYGDVTEEVLLSLAEAAGHSVTGRQDVMMAHGIKGHRDGVIDGMLIDVKSASTYGFKKFKENGLRADDPFGYLPQLAGYLLASQDDPLVTNKTEAAYLVMDKQHGHLVLDTYDLSKEMEQMEQLIADRKEMVDYKTPPIRPYKDKAFQKSGNRMLDIQCSYCEYKKTCWPTVRTFLYSRGPVHLTKVVDEPRVPEVKYDVPE